jgi:hypothetical protein
VNNPRLIAPAATVLPEVSPSSQWCQRWTAGRHSWRHTSEGGFDPVRYLVEPISEDTARTWVVQHHYSGSYPAASRRCGQFTRAGTLLGVCVLGIPMSTAVLTGERACRGPAEIQGVAGHVDHAAMAGEDGPAVEGAWHGVGEGDDAPHACFGRVGEHASDEPRLLAEWTDSFATNGYRCSASARSLAEIGSATASAVTERDKSGDAVRARSVCASAATSSKVAYEAIWRAR